MRRLRGLSSEKLSTRDEDGRLDALESVCGCLGLATMCLMPRFARKRIGHFIDHYNFQRPHQGVEGLVPADRYFQAAPVRELVTMVAAKRFRSTDRTPC